MIDTEYEYIDMQEPNANISQDGIEFQEPLNSASSLQNFLPKLMLQKRKPYFDYEEALFTYFLYKFNLI